MSEPKPINFRCFCLECDVEDGRDMREVNGVKTDPPDIADEKKDDSQYSSRNFAGTIGRLLFGA